MKLPPCKYRIGPSCEIVSRIGSLPLSRSVVTPQACVKCAETSTPDDGKENRVVAGVALYHIRQIGAKEEVEAFRQGHHVILYGENQSSAVRAAAEYTKAVMRWVAAGRPLRTDDEVLSIFQGTCRPCAFYDEAADGVSKCRKCRCHISLSGGPLINKIRMGTEHCDYGGW